MITKLTEIANRLTPEQIHNLNQTFHLPRTWWLDQPLAEREAFEREWTARGWTIILCG